jgi:hypothetical protein
LALAKVVRELWGGIIKYEDDDTPYDVRFYNAFGKSALLWLEQSRALHRAAIALMRKESMWCGAMTPDVNTPIALMLGGYAVETLLKMVIIGDYCDAKGLTYDALRAKDFLPTSHNLQKLAEKAALRTCKADRELLTKLSKYPVWAGRYPIPMESSGYDGPAIFDRISGGERLAENPVWTEYVPLYEKLHKLGVRKTFKGQLAPSRKQSGKAL